MPTSGPLNQTLLFSVSQNGIIPIINRNDGININVISTSEIKISVLINEKDAEKATKMLHKFFELDR